MTKQELKKAIEIAVKNGMEDVVKVYADTRRKGKQPMIDVSIIYGQFGIETATLTLTKLHRDNLEVWAVDGKIKMYQINDINKELAKIL